MLYANMVDHSVIAQDKLYESEASWAVVFCLTVLPQKSLASSMIWSILVCYAYEFLCS